MLRLDWQLTMVSLAIVPLVVGTFIFLRISSSRIDFDRNRKAQSSGAGRSELDSDGPRIWTREFEVRRSATSQPEFASNLRLHFDERNSALVIST
jgi:hypothetical protein